MIHKNILNYNFLDGGFNWYSLDEDRALFSCNLHGEWKSHNLDIENGTKGYGGADVLFSTSKIKPSVYIKDGSIVAWEGDFYKEPTVNTVIRLEKSADNGLLKIPEGAKKRVSYD